jgi:hypothetical protein
MPFPPLPSSSQDRALQLFPEFNPSRNGMVTRSAVAEIFAKYQIQLDHVSLDTFFADGDVDGDGFLSQSEFLQVFCHHYTTLLDVLYYRWRDGEELKRLIDEARRVGELTAERINTSSALRRDLTKHELLIEEIQHSRIKADERSLMGQAKVQEAVKRYEGQQSRVTFAAQYLDECAADVGAARSLFDVRCEEEEAWRGRANQWNEALTELEKDVATAMEEEQRLARELALAQERVRKNQNLLQEGIQNRASCDASHREAIQQLEDARERFEGMLQSLRNAEAEWQHQIDILHDEEAVMLDLEAKAEGSRQVHVELSLDLEEKQNQYRQMNQELDGLLAEVERHREHENRIRSTMKQFQDQRQAKLQPENLLIQQELQLREERRRLQLKEVQVRGSAASLYRDLH